MSREGSAPAGIVVTGASRGLGAALAARLADPAATILLVGRDGPKLDAVAATCRQAGAAVEIARLDVRDRAAMAETLSAFDSRHPVRLAIANAGVALPTGTAVENEAATYGEIDVNLIGSLNTILPLIGPMTARGRGQLCFVTSLAALVPLPDSPGYSASKAALLMYGLSLRERVRASGIRVNVVCPGYVETDMGARYRGGRPLEMSPARAADIIARGLAANRPVIAFPRSLALVSKLSTFVPERLRRIGLKGFRFSIDRQ